MERTGHLISPNQPELIPGKLLVKIRSKDVDLAPIVEEAITKINREKKTWSLETLPSLRQKKPNTKFHPVTLTSVNPAAQRKIVDTRGSETSRAAVAAVSRWHEITVNQNADLRPLLALLQHRPEIEAVEPVQRYYLQQLRLPENDPPGGPPFVNDPFYSSVGSWGIEYESRYGSNVRDLWGLGRINIESAWANAGTNPVVVAVTDSGIDYSHPDIQANLWTNSNEAPEDSNADGCPGVCGVDDDQDGEIDEGDYFDDDENGYSDDIHGISADSFLGPDGLDDNGHGTHVAGTIGAVSNNGVGIAGVAGPVQLMSVKMFDSSGQAEITWILSGLLYAIENGAQVINMSWGGPGESQALTDVLQYATSQGISLVAAAGNSSQSAEDSYPANVPHVITVAAWSPADRSASFSNYGPRVDTAAPGEGILSLRAADTDIYCTMSPDYCLPQYSRIEPDASGNPIYYWMDGTSMAAPHVSGVVALLKSKAPTIGPDVIREIIRESSTPVSESCDLTINQCRGSSFYSCQSDTDCQDQGIGSFGVLDAGRAMNMLQGYIDQPRPELLMNAASATMATANAGSLAADVSNQGTASSAPGILMVQYGETGSGIPNTTHELPSLAPGQRHQLTVPLTKAQAIPLRLTLIVDPTNQIPELIETNNEKIVEISPTLFSGWPVKASEAISTSSPTIVDIDRDGSDDIVFGDFWYGRVFAYRQNGQLLPGWPVQLQPLNGNEIYSTPLVVDLDGDTTLEVVVATGRGGAVYVLRQRPGLPTAWEVAPGWPFQTGPSLRGPEPWRYRIVGSPAMGNFDSDSLPEIVIGASDGKTYVLNGDGSLVSGWPQQTPSDIYATPVVADLDRNGFQEVIVGSRLNQMNAWNSLGQSLSPWPRPTAGLIHGGAAVADVNQDGFLEIAAGDIDASGLLAKSYLWRHSGSNYPGWPVSLPETNWMGVQKSVTFSDVDGDRIPNLIVVSNQWVGNRINVYKPDGTQLPNWPIQIDEQIYGVATANLDDDPEIEIVASGGSTGIFIFNHDGSRLPGWPQQVPGTWLYNGVVSQPAIADLNRDGRQEIIAATHAGDVYIWTVQLGSYELLKPWPTEAHDFNRTGRYTPPPKPRLKPVLPTRVE